MILKNYYQTFNS